MFIAPSVIAVLLRQNLPVAQIAKAMALFTAVFAIGQAIGPVLAGEIADWHGPGASLWLGAALLALATVLPWGMRRSTAYSAPQR